MWKYFFLGLLVGWLLEWIIDWFYWRRGTDAVTGLRPAAGDVPEGLVPRAGAAAEAAARVAMAAEPAGARIPAVPVTAVEGAADPRAAVGAAGSVPEPNLGRSTAAGTAAGRVAAEVAVGAPGAVSTSSATLTSRAPVYRQEDLEAVIGVGPKIGAMLRNNGITTFAELMVTPASELERIVESTGEEPEEAGVETWATQAGLAAAQDWEGLARLQDELLSSGARREA
jgi:predicted flap endonuclease-1-like 5' DNA nuclease